MRIRPIDIAIILCVSLLCVISSYKMKIDHNAELIRHMYGTLQGHPWGPEFQSRLLAPWMLKGLVFIGRHRISDEQNYKIVRVFSALFAFGTIYYCTLSQTRSYSKSLLATGLCGYGYLWTVLIFYMEYPEDLFDMGFVYLLCWLCLRGAVAWLFPLMLLTCLNRESGVFGGVIYFCLYADVRDRRKLPWRTLFLAVTMSGLAYLFVLGVRYSYAGHLTRQFLGITVVLQNWRYALQPFGWLVCFCGMFLPLVALLYTARKSFGEKSVRIMVAAAIVVVPTLIFGIVNEIRIFLPVYCLFVFALMESKMSIQIDVSQPD